MNLVRMNLVRNSMQSSHRAGSLPLIGAMRGTGGGKVKRPMPVSTVARSASLATI
jgi:hypothetical protein